MAHDGHYSDPCTRWILLVPLLDSCEEFITGPVSGELPSSVLEPLVLEITPSPLFRAVGQGLLNMEWPPVETTATLTQGETSSVIQSTLLWDQIKARMQLG